MALPALGPLFDRIAAEALVRAGRALSSKMPWARDNARADAVEARIRRLATDATQLARNLTEEAIEPQIGRLLDQFEKDLATYGLNSEQAAELTEVEREQLLVTVIEPAKERRQVQKWLKDLEDRAVQAEKALAENDRTAKRLADLERKVAVLNVLLGVALSLAVVATLLSILFFTRK